MKLFILGLALSVVLLVIGQATAQQYTGRGTAGATVQFQGTGSSSTGRMGRGYLGATFSIDLSLDTSVPSVLVDQATFHVGELSRSETDDFTAGFGDVVAITRRITLDSFSVTATNAGPYALDPHTDGKFIIDRQAGSADFDSTFALSGSYEIIGPTQSASGSFSVPYKRLSYTFPRFFIDANEFPSSLVLECITPGNAKMVYQPVSTSSVFSAEVDGVLISYEPSTLRFYTPDDILLTHMPEPSTLTLAAFGLLTLLAVAGRKHHRWRPTAW